MNTGVFESALHRDFVGSMITDAHARGALISGQIRCGATILSAGCGIVSGDEFMFYQFACDAAYASFSPSRLLLECLIRRCSERGLLVFDFRLPNIDCSADIHVRHFIAGVHAENLASVKMHRSCGMDIDADFAFLFARVSRTREAALLGAG
jgi:hypothetical protein